MNVSVALAQPFMLIVVLTMGLPAGAQNVTTSQYDNARSCAHRLETTLTPRNVNVRHFGEIFTLKVDGDIYAQPLFLTGLDIPGTGRHDVLFVATEHICLRRLRTSRLATLAGEVSQEGCHDCS